MYRKQVETLKEWWSELNQLCKIIENGTDDCAVGRANQDIHTKADMSKQVTLGM